MLAVLTLVHPNVTVPETMVWQARTLDQPHRAGTVNIENFTCLCHRSKGTAPIS